MKKHTQAKDIIKAIVAAGGSVEVTEKGHLKVKGPAGIAIVGPAPGSRGCDVIRTREGLIVVTLGDDEGSVVEAGRRFVTWLDGHVPAVRAITPDVWAGTVLIHGTEIDSGKEGARE